MKLFRSVVLAHHPRRRFPNLTKRTLSQSDDLRIELLYRRITSLDSFFDSRQGVLDVSRILLVSEISSDVFVGKFSAKPSAVPSEKGHDDEQRRQNNQRQ